MILLAFRNFLFSEKLKNGRYAMINYIRKNFQGFEDKNNNVNRVWVREWYYPNKSVRDHKALSRYSYLHIIMRLYYVFL